MCLLAFVRSTLERGGVLPIGGGGRVKEGTLSSGQRTTHWPCFLQIHCHRHFAARLRRLGTRSFLPPRNARSGVTPMVDWRGSRCTRRSSTRHSPPTLGEGGRVSDPTHPAYGSRRRCSFLSGGVWPQHRRASQ